MTLIPWLVAIYAAICAVVYFGNRLFMYFPNPTRAAPAEAGLDHVKEIEIAAADGVTLVAWYAPARGDKPTILYFHGNAANAANRAPRIELIQENGFGVLYSEQSRLWRLRRKTHGRGQCRRCDHGLRSLDWARGAARQDRRLRRVAGSGQAVRLAAARPVAAVVLEAPLTSTVDVARRTYFWLPISLLITDKYNNERNIRSVTAPVLILHGEQDGVIPVEMGRRVYRGANQPKRIELFPQGTHDDLFDHGAWEKTRAFVDSLSGSTREESDRRPRTLV